MRDGTLGPTSAPTPRAAVTRVIAHVDMDAFFASIEQRDDPTLRGFPVIIGADPASGRGVVSTASYEARKFGVGSAMPNTRAHRLCPQGVFLRPRIAHYSSVSREVFRIFEDVDVKESASIDEAYLDVSSRFTKPSDAREWALALKGRVRAEHALTCSIGIGPNRLVAKIASDIQKPDGLTIVDADDTDSFLAALPARKIPGVGPKTDVRLRELGVTTCAELAELPRSVLETEFGVWGPRLGELARGIDETPIVDEWMRKSAGAETTFLHDTQDRDEIATALAGCAEEAWESLKHDGLVARTVTLKIRYADFTTFTRARSLTVATDAKHVLADAARGLLQENPPAHPLRLLGVRYSNLSDAGLRQETLAKWPADVLGAANEWRPLRRRLDEFDGPR